MAEENWRVNARGRRVPNRVTSNMRAFTGEKPVGGRDRAGRRYNRGDGGTGRRVSVTSSGNRSVRSKSTAKNPGVGPTGGTRTSDVDRPSNVERRGRGPSPITSSRTRSVRVKQATDRRRTVGGDGQREFKTGPSRVTRGRGGYAGYRYVRPGSNLPIRQVNPTTTGKPVNRRSGQGRTNTTSPNAQKTNQRTGSSPMRGPGKPGSANDTGSRRTGGGRKGQISSKGGLQTTSGYKPKMNQKGPVKANTILKGVASLLSKRLNVAMTGYDILMLGKKDSVLSKAISDIGKKQVSWLPSSDARNNEKDIGRILSNKIASLASKAYKRVKGGSETKAETSPPKKETKKEPKPKRKTKQLVKK
jgi:hypothetical protein